MAVITFICYHLFIMSLLSHYIFLCYFASLDIHFYVISIDIIALRHNSCYHFQPSIQSHYNRYYVILNIVHIIHTVCLNWLYRIVSFMVISQYFINISCTHRQLQPNPLYCILAFIIWFIFIVCPCIHTVIYFHFTQWHCLYIISLTIILDNSHLQFVGV